ncbi:MAG TPA: class I SAM-dependent methyltransferase [Elusimicrobiales bacterium]|nr:class I SAM-dependent methyltransferase [Elusimicrobiales bacterium]
MNPYIAAALAEMDKVQVSRLEHPGAGALDPASCRFLAAFIQATGARKIVEFGSGFSSLMIAREIAGLEGNSLLSIDNSPRLSAAAKESFENSGAQAKAQFRVAPLKLKWYGLSLLLSYSLPRGLLEALGPFDLALIDAPPHHTYASEAAFYDVFPAIAPGGYILLGEANQAGEKNVEGRGWLDAYGDAARPILLEGIGNGIYVVEKFEEARRARRSVADSFLTSCNTLRSAGRLRLRGES